MRKIKDVLRLRYWEEYSLRATARCLSISVSTVSNYINRAAEAQLEWPLPDELTDAELQERFFPKPKEAAARPVPDWSWASTVRSPTVTISGSGWQPTTRGQVARRIGAHVIVYEGARDWGRAGRYAGLSVLHPFPR